MNVAVRAPGGGSLVEQAVGSIREHIRAGGLKVGDTLPGEGWFATEIGVSRAVMREAFGALAALKVIDVGNGRRARVGAIDGSVMGDAIAHAVTTAQVSVAEVWDVRRTLEMRTAELAASNRSQDDADEIARAADAMQAAGDDLAEITRHDIRFHQAIARASGNLLFHQVVRSFEPLMTVAVPTAWRTRVTPEQQTAIFEQHALIAQRIAERDAAGAASTMGDHFVASIGDMFGVR